MTTRLSVTFAAVTPVYWARVRSMSTASVGRPADCWMRASATPGDVADLRQKLVRVGKIRAKIVAPHLQIDRRGRPEIQDLADDIGGQKRERHAGKAPRQLVAQPAT